VWPHEQAAAETLDDLAFRTELQNRIGFGVAALVTETRRILQALSAHHRPDMATIGIHCNFSNGAHRSSVRQLRPTFGDAVRIRQNLRERLRTAIQATIASTITIMMRCVSPTPLRRLCPMTFSCGRVNTSRQRVVKNWRTRSAFHNASHDVAGTTRDTTRQRSDITNAATGLSTRLCRTMPPRSSSGTESDFAGTPQSRRSVLLRALPRNVGTGNTGANPRAAVRGSIRDLRNAEFSGLNVRDDDVQPRSRGRR
jgi:hypothetical protein